MPWIYPQIVTWEDEVYGITLAQEEQLMAAIAKGCTFIPLPDNGGYIAIKLIKEFKHKLYWADWDHDSDHPPAIEHGKPGIPSKREIEEGEQGKIESGV